MSRTPLSGARFRLSAAGYLAEIASVGATLRVLRRDSTDLIASFPADGIRPAMRGALLVPWPNRTGDGNYEFDGVAHSLVVDDRTTGSALHGLISWLEFEPVEQSHDRVLLRGVIQPQPGYPWRLRVEVEFTLDDDGLAQEVTVTNLSERRAPAGIGAHPYLLAEAAGAGVADRWILTLPADTVMLTDDRLLPVRETDVAGSDVFDFRASRALAGVVLNHAFTGLTRGHDRIARAAVTDADGRGVEISWDERCGWVHVYTADEPVGGHARAAVAIEPMTCPPDAFNSKRDLRILESGESMSAGWRLRQITPAP